MTRRTILFAWLIVASASASVSAVGQSWKTARGTVVFTSSVPLYDFSGVSEHLTGVVNMRDSTVDFFLDLSTLKTGIGKRDKDMLLSLDVKRFPFAEFYGRLVSAFDSTTSGRQAAVVEGEFKLHGILKAISVTGTLENVGDELRLEAAWEVNLKDYDIVPPRLLILKVDEIQRVTITGTLRRVPSS